MLTTKCPYSNTRTHLLHLSSSSKVTLFHISACEINFIHNITSATLSPTYSSSSSSQQLWRFCDCLHLPAFLCSSLWQSTRFTCPIEPATTRQRHKEVPPAKMRSVRLRNCRTLRTTISVCCTVRALWVASRVKLRQPVARQPVACSAQASCELLVEF